MFFRRGRVLWLPVNAQDIPADVEPLWTDMLSVAGDWLSCSPQEATSFLKREKLLPFVTCAASDLQLWDQWIAGTVARNARVGVQAAYTKETRRRLLEAREADPLAIRSISISYSPVEESRREMFTQTDPVLVLNPPSNLIGNFSFEEMGGYLSRKLDVLRLFGVAASSAAPAAAGNLRKLEIPSCASLAPTPGPVPLFGTQTLTRSEPDPEETPRSLEISSDAAVSEGGGQQEPCRVEELLVACAAEAEDDGQGQGQGDFGGERNDENEELLNASDGATKWETGTSFAGTGNCSLASNSSSGSYRYKRGLLKNPRSSASASASASASRMQWYSREEPC